MKVKKSMHWLRSSLLLLLGTYGTLSIAAESQSPTIVSGFSWKYFGKLGFALLAVLLFFMVFAWTMRRYQNYGRSPSQGLSVVASLSLGARERLVVVQAGSTQVLLGITPTQINSLTVLESPLEPDVESTQPSFRVSLEKLLVKETGQA